MAPPSEGVPYNTAPNRKFRVSCAVASLPCVANMAARRVLRLAERQARWLRPLPRPQQRIGQWREAQGLPPSPSGPGPVRDLPDWSFSDGRPSPPWRGQLRRRRENEELVCRALSLGRSLEAAKLRGGPRGGGAATPNGSQYKPV